MLRIMLPCWPFEDQLHAKTQLLRDLVGDRFPIGLEIGMSMDLMLQPLFLEQAKRRIKAMDFEEDFFLGFHGPQALAVGTDLQQNFFVSEQGILNFGLAIDFARSIKAQLVNVHAQQPLDYATISKMSAEEVVRAKKQMLHNAEFVLRRLKQRKRSAPAICIENIPHNLRTDWQRSPEDALFELTFVDLADFKEIVDPAKGIFATIDICHLAQVYDSSELLDQIWKIPSDAIRHIHFSDVGGSWHPFISLASEGVIPGQGRIGGRVMRELLGYFVHLSRKQDINLMIEVNDENLVEIAESRESLKIVLGWLKGIID